MIKEQGPQKPSLNTTPSMSQKIFDLELPVETVSLYLLISGLTDEGQPVFPETIRPVWNGSEQELESGLQDLEKRNIIRKVTEDDGERKLYRLVDPDQWRV
ncbi:MAG: hypothetical protein R6U50_10030 [Desulfobacterales bacterium]